jgi:hypothetical protein
MSNFSQIIGALNDLLRESIIDQPLYNDASTAARDIEHAWNSAHPPSSPSVYDELFDDLDDSEDTIETMHKKIEILQKKLTTQEASYDNIMMQIHAKFPTATSLQIVSTMCRQYMQHREEKRQKSGLIISCPINQEIIDKLTADRRESLDFNELSDEQMCLTKCNHLFGTNFMLNWCKQVANRQLEQLNCPQCRRVINEVYSLSACPSNQAAIAQRMNSYAFLFDMMFLRAFVLALEGMVNRKHGGFRKTTKRNKKNKHTKNKARKSRRHRKSSRKH